MPELVSLLPIFVIALLFWLLIIRPASRRQKDLARMQGALQVGDEVMLTSGIFGRLTATGDDHLHVEVSDGVVVRVARGAIANVVTTPVEPSDPTPGTGGSEEN